MPFKVHRGQTTGIFYAPTTLSGLDPNHSLNRFTRPSAVIGRQSSSAERYEQEYVSVVKQQSGAMEDSTE